MNLANLSVSASVKIPRLTALCDFQIKNFFGQLFDMFCPNFLGKFCESIILKTADLAQSSILVIYMANSDTCTEQ